MNMQNGKIVPWDSLTDEQRESGEWVKLPPRDSDGHCDARQRSALEMLIRTPAQPTAESLNRLAPPRGSFDALGRPR